jgi:hypothetical protein
MPKSSLPLDTGTREFFLETAPRLGYGADIANFAGPGGRHPCVKETDAGGDFLVPNTGNLQQIARCAVSSWIAQTTKNMPDVHGITLLGNIAGIPSLAIDTTATGFLPSLDRLVDNFRSFR